MKTYISQPKSSDTVQPKSSKQASTKDVLQAYKDKIVQRQDIDEDELLQGKFNDTAQLEGFEEDELLQGKFDTAQREELDEDELLQGKFDASSAMQKEEAIQPASENNTGMPDNLKTGIEALSGYSMDDVRVHYNSPKPAQLQALAYAQGTDIHIASGQEEHLPHEAWHVVQQKQGHVQPTTQLQGINVNDNEGLEKEADVMGGKAVQLKLFNTQKDVTRNISSRIVQRVPEEQIKERAYYLWEKRKKADPTYDNPQRDYYDAEQELLIEERAYLLSEKRKVGDPTYDNPQKDYYDAEHELLTENIAHYYWEERKKANPTYDDPQKDYYDAEHLIKHVFDGEINAKKKAVGFHHEGTNKARMTNLTNGPNAKGIYKGKVEILNPITGVWKKKGSESSFFPKEMSRHVVIKEIISAFQNKTKIPNKLDNKWEGISGGLKIGGYVDVSDLNKIMTAFPIY